MEQKTERFIKKVENAFASGKVSIIEFEILIKEWRQFISVRCYEEEDSKQIHRNLNHLKLTMDWFRRRCYSDKNEDLLEFFQIMIDYISVELESLKLNSDVRKITSDIAGTPEDTMSWTASKRALIEVICALHLANCINDGNISIKKMVVQFSKLFKINLDNYHPEISKMTTRTPLKDKGLRAYFLSSLVKRFNEKMTNLK
ncbi:RteC domain-containing protein [Saccharicrinis sp. 156]|uniref:RteC domain-containing protein n=1 Tax=Saccharicrinis sp. 156 TaxID=3417574 RepID=UPI003D3312F2